MMREATGDLFSYPCDALVVPCNWTTKKNGDAVMGAGVAKQAAARWPWLPASLGYFIRSSPAYPHNVSLQAVKNGDPRLFFVVSLPTKRHWRNGSDLALIEAGARDVARTATNAAWKTVTLPQLGCGLGGLKWSEVQPILARHLDDRFVVLTPERRP